MTGVEIPRDAWRSEAVPPHLLMNFKVMDEQDPPVAMGRDLTALQHAQGARAAATFASLPTIAFERERVTEWDFGDLPTQLEFTHHGARLTGYPALVAEKEGVALRVLDTPEKAEVAMRAGLRRLYAMQLKDKLKYIERNLPVLTSMCLHYAPVGACDRLKQDLVEATSLPVVINCAAPRSGPRRTCAS